MNQEIITCQLGSLTQWNVLRCSQGRVMPSASISRAPGTGSSPKVRSGAQGVMPMGKRMCHSPANSHAGGKCKGVFLSQITAVYFVLLLR